MIDLRTRATAAFVASSVMLAACGSGDSQEDGARATPDRPAAPAATLERSSFGGPVTVDRGTTHDGDVTIDRGTGRIYASWAKDGRKPPKANFTPQDVFVASSDDGGRTWSAPVRVNRDVGSVNAGFNSQVRVVSTGEDRVLVTWPIMSEDHSVMNAMAALSSDGGRTFSRPKPLSGADGPATSEMYQALATYGRNVFAAYLDYRSGLSPRMPTGLNVVHSSDGGRTFSKSMRGEVSTCECCDNAMAVDSKGTLFVAFRNKDKTTRNTQVRDTAIIRSYDQGETWSDPKPLGKDDWVFNGCPEAGPELAVDRRDGVHGVYWTGKPGRPGVYYTRSTDGGVSFDRPVAVAVDEFYPPAYMDLAVEDDGSAWIVWDDRRTKDRKVRIGRARGGRVETTETPLGPGVTPAVDSDGRFVAVSWSDAEGFHVMTRGQPKRTGYGSGPGSAQSGQERKRKGHGH